MLLRELEYVKPDSVDEALEWLGRLSDAGLLAGGQSLINVLKMRIGGYQTLIDISKLEDLKRIEMVGQGIRIGAGVTYDELLHSPAISLYRPLLQEVALRIADPQVRRASAGPECSRVWASPIMPNSSVPEWVSTGMRPVSASTTRKNATAASMWAGLISWAIEE